MRAEIDRRVLILAYGALLLGAPGQVSFAQVTVTNTHPAVTYVGTVANELLAAQSQGTVEAFMKTLSRRADVQGIGDYALGRFQTKLPDTDRPTYYRGVTNYMARYFVEQMKKYRVARAAFEDKPREDNEDFLVSSKVTLVTGKEYTVIWRVTPKGSGYRVSDVKVLGFSLSFLQRGIFLGYIAKKGGNVKALVTALARWL